MPNPLSHEQGIFLLSLDTELAWGYFDHPKRVRDKIFSPDGSRERRAVSNLLNMFEAYDIRATWSVVGHMFHSAWEADPEDPVLAWAGKYDSFDQIYQSSHPLWYGSDIVEEILAGRPQQEVAVHGHTHRPLGEDDIRQEEFRIELKAWQESAARKGVTGSAMTYPRNRIGHLELLADYGIRSYRGQTQLPPVAQVPIVGKVLNRIDTHLQIYPPRLLPVPDPTTGPLNLEASYWLFGINRSLELGLDSIGMSLARMRRVRAAVSRAARKAKVLHLWAHPWEFRTAADFAKLAFVLDEVQTQRKDGRLISMTMTELQQMVSVSSRKVESY